MQHICGTWGKQKVIRPRSQPFSLLHGHGCGAIATNLRRALQMVSGILICPSIRAANAIARVLPGNVSAVAADGWWYFWMSLEVSGGAGTTLILRLVARRPGSLSMSKHSLCGAVVGIRVAGLKLVLCRLRWLTLAPR